MTDEKQKNLVKLLLGFPSMATADKTQMAGMLASYLEILSNFSSEAVCAACDVLRRRQTQFPPTAGEVHAECEKQQEKRREMHDWIAIGAPKVRFDRLPPPPPPRYSLQELQDWEFPINDASPPYVMRGEWFGDTCKPFRIPAGYPGAGQLAEYGYLTPKEIQMAAEARRRKANKRRQDETRFADMDKFARETI